MPIDASRFPAGTVISGLTTADVAPVGTIIEVNGVLYRSNSAVVANWSTLTSFEAGRLLPAVQGTVDANPDTFTVAGAAIGDYVWATIASEDTGVNKLVSIVGATVTAPDTVTLTFSGTGPTNNDGTVNILVSDQT